MSPVEFETFIGGEDRDVLGFGRPMPRRRHIAPTAYRRTLRIVDFLLLEGCALAAYEWKLRSFGPHALVLLALASLVAHLRLWRSDVFDRRSLVSMAAQFATVVPTIARGTLVTALMLLPAPLHDLFIVPCTWTLIAGPVLLFWRLAVAAVSGTLYNRSMLIRHIAVYGLNDKSVAFIEHIEEHGDGFGRIVGVFDDRTPDGAEAHAIPIAGSALDLINIAARNPIDTIALALPLDAPARLRALSERFRRTGADIVVICPMQRMSTSVYGNAKTRDYAVLDLDRRPIDEFQAFQKTLFDKAVALVALLVLALPLLLIALAIRIESRGPVLFRQPRTGLNDSMFRINKFRTMFHEMSDLGAQRQTSRDDPRVTRVGRVLRRLSIDELPQLINVLNGDMSLVGPRPHAPNTAVDGQPLEAVFADYVFRHRVKPGITGWAQVNRARGELRTAEDVRRRVEHDLTYIENWSLAFDIRILLLTFAREILSARAY